VPSTQHTQDARSKKKQEARRQQAAQADAASKKGTLVNGERWSTLFITDVIKRRKMLCICFNAASL
jgi:hypothetical protein